MIKQIIADVGRVVRAPGFAGHQRHSEVRVSGEVDGRAWDGLAATMVRATEEIESTMVRSAALLEDAGRPGIEAISALLLFEGLPREQDEDDRRGPRPTHGAVDPQATSR